MQRNTSRIADAYDFEILFAIWSGWFFWSSLHTFATPRFSAVAMLFSIFGGSNVDKDVSGFRKHKSQYDTALAEVREIDKQAQRTFKTPHNKQPQGNLLQTQR